MTSPNPAGRPAGTLARIRAMSDDGQAYEKAIHELATGQVPGNNRDRFEAAKYLYERLNGQLPEFQVTADATASLPALLDLGGEDLRLLARGAALAQGSTPGLASQPPDTVDSTDYPLLSRLPPEGQSSEEKQQLSETPGDSSA